MPFADGQGSGILAGGRLTGTWRYDRRSGRGIALSYDRGASGPRAARLPGVDARGRLTGRWRYNRVAGRGVALRYDQNASEPPAPTAARPEPWSPTPTHSAMVRVLCSCGDVFTFEDDAGTCPSCGRPAEWPTMGQVEREMRSDLAELLRTHEQGADPE